MDARGRVMLSRGEQVAGYEIEGYVARGGMAVVYRARDLSLGRAVALKVIAPEFADNDTFRQRFIRESELAASIDHPNVLPIYQAGEADGLLYIAMRFVDGPDLGALLADEGPLELADALPIFGQVAAALDTAHAHDLVHRDVKPGNILISSGTGPIGERHAYLTDFGLTKRSSSLSGFTTAGHFLGTISYIAPEQISGQEVTGRADVYAFGCVLYEALAGVPPFERDDDAALLWAHMQVEPAPLSQLRPSLPPAVDAVLGRALAKDPDHRAPSCRAVMADLRAALRPADGSVDGSAPSSSSPVPVPVTGAGAVPEAGAVPGVADVQNPLPATGFVPADTGARARYRIWGAAAIVGALVIALAYVMVPRLMRSDFVTYDGSDPAASWLAFDRPREWPVLADPTLAVACVCTGRYGPVFEDGDWRAVISAINDGTSVEGVYLKQTSGLLTLDSAADVAGVAADTFRDIPIRSLASPRSVTIGGRPVWEIDGTLTATKDPSLKLEIRYLLVHNAAGTKTDHLILFAQDTQVGKLASRLDHVARSIVFKSQG